MVDNNLEWTLCKQCWPGEAREKLFVSYSGLKDYFKLFQSGAIFFHI